MFAIDDNVQKFPQNLRVNSLFCIQKEILVAAIDDNSPKFLQSLTNNDFLCISVGDTDGFHRCQCASITPDSHV